MDSKSTVQLTLNHDAILRVLASSSEIHKIMRVIGEDNWSVRVACDDDYTIVAYVEAEQ